MTLPDLPVGEVLPTLMATLATSMSAVLCAPPGSGKTTLVPLALLAAPWLAGKSIIVLEPRRVAARAAAARMAQLCAEAVGETVGYQVRFDRKVGPRTRVEVLTEGLLTRRLQADAELPGVGLVIFDEFHERSLEADLALALTVDARANLRPDLRVLVMSATLNAERIAALLDDAPVVRSDGRMFPVEVVYRPTTAGVAEAVAGAVMAGLAEDEGDVLAFLPGAREIRDARDLAQTAALLRGNQRVRMPPATQLGMAMRFGARALAAQQSCWKLTLDISGDGKSNAGPRPRDVRNSGVLGRATVNGLLISSTGPGLENYYRAEVLHGPDAFVEKARGYSAYSDAMRRKLLRELKILAIGALDPAEVTPADLAAK